MSLVVVPLSGCRWYPAVKRSQANGSTFAGYLPSSVDFDHVVSVLGDNHFGLSRDGKVKWEWVFALGSPDCPVVFTIYDYKRDGRFHVGLSGILNKRVYRDLVALFV